MALLHDLPVLLRRGKFEEKSFMIRFRTGLILRLMLILPLAAGAQEKAEIVFAQGEGFSLVRNGNTEFHDLYLEAAEGMTLLPGDVILTEEDTWMEIELNHSNSLIKIAENTTFTISSLENSGGTFQVSYGRIRARVEKLSDETPFWIQGVDTVAGVRGTDFGYDLFYDRESPELTRTDVYCFKGKVEVVQIPVSADGTAGTPEKGEEGTARSVIIGKNEMVSVLSDSRETLEVESVTRELKEYWDINEFQYEPIQEKTPINPEVNSFAAFHNDSRQLRQAALFSGVSGALITATGLAGYFAADSPPSFAIGMGSVGGVLMGGAGYFAIRALILDSRSGAEVPAEQP